MAIKNRNRNEVTEIELIASPIENIRELGINLKVKDLLRVNKKYRDNAKEWEFLLAVYSGIREIVKRGYILQHEREPDESYERRLEELYSLNYSKSVIEIFQHFLFKKNPQERSLGRLHDDELWNQFYNDADLFGNKYEAAIMDIANYASIQGHVGILIDKANVIVENRAQEIENMVYPYISKYLPKAIYDWEYKRDEYNKPYLSYLKILDDDNKFRLWSPDKWEIWEIPRDSKGELDKKNTERLAKKVDEGINPLGVIPFVWHYNFKSMHLNIGNSDIHEIARIDLSIIKNFSQIEQIVNYAAFPMLLMPMQAADPVHGNVSMGEDEVSVKAVQEFDPQEPNSKPEWMKAEVSEPIQAIWDIIKGKISEIYRAANIGGLASTEPTKTAQSGIAKVTDFQMLNAKLVNKAINLENTENKIVEFWLRWQKQWEELKDEVNMSRPKTYNVEDLATDLSNALTAKTVIMSSTFNAMIQKQTARVALPGATEKDLSDIDSEIEENVKKRNSSGKIIEDEDNKKFIDEGGAESQSEESDEIEESQEKTEE